MSTVVSALFSNNTLVKSLHLIHFLISFSYDFRRVALLPELVCKEPSIYFAIYYIIKCKKKIQYSKYNNAKTSQNLIDTNIQK